MLESPGHRSGTFASAQAIPALTSLRFFAALAVVLHHYAEPTLGGSPGAMQTVVKQGFQGVGFFYVLSGFVLAHAYSGRELGTTTFWSRRAARILPALWLAFLLSAPRVIVHHVETSGPLIGGTKVAIAATINLLMLDAWLPWLSSAWNSPAWSVSVEVFFYALFPWLFPWITRLRAPKALFVFALAWIVGLAIPATALLASRMGLARADGLQDRLPLLHVPAFICGMCARQLVSDPAIRSRLARVRSVTVPLSLACAVAAFTVDWSALAPLPALNLHVPVWAALFIALTTAEAGGLPILSAQPLTVLGEASYALYILQGPVWSVLAAVHGPATSLARFFTYLAALIATSLLVWRYLELPAKPLFERGAQQFLQRMPRYARSSTAMLQRAGDSPPSDSS